MRLTSKFSILTATLSVTVSATMTLSSPPDKIALTGARIIPVVGEEIETGTIVVEHGRITALGPSGSVDIPYDAMEYELDGLVIMPGMIDPDSSSGLDRANEAIPIVPFLDVYDAIDPSRLFFEDSLRDGVTTVHVTQGSNTVISGLSRVVRPIGLSIDEMTVFPELALKLVTSPRSGADRMEQLATLREAFYRLEDELDRLAEKRYLEKQEAEGGSVHVSPDEARQRGRELLTDSDYDDSQINLVRMLRGDVMAWWHAGAATDVKPAVDLARELGILDHSVFILGTESYRALDELKDAGRPVVLSPTLTHRQRDAITGHIDEVFIPRKVYDAGLMFALQPNPGASMAERYLTYQAAQCVRHGVPREEALKAITINPAKMMGLGDELGSIEVGKVANFVVMSGDPLDFSSWIEKVFIDGVLAYDRARDHRLQELLRLETSRDAPAIRDVSSQPSPDSDTDAPTGSDNQPQADGQGDGE